MITELSNFAARLGHATSWLQEGHAFNEWALELFALQFKHNSAYQKICQARGLTPGDVRDWTQIPYVPTAAFKELELSSIMPEARTAVFHSSGTTEQKPSRHFHCAESLELYEASLWKWFETNIIYCGRRGDESPISPQFKEEVRDSSRRLLPHYDLLALTPPPHLVPHSSLVHMFETVRREFNAPESVFVGKLDGDGAWALDFDRLIAALSSAKHSKLILGTAFSFVHLLDYLAENDLRFDLPRGSRVMETGGYKNRSRSLPKTRLHFLITTFLGIARENIICEYGMSELGSQAYDSNAGRNFLFPPWARAQIVSPETGREVLDGETGLIRILDLANVFSVAAIQTEDLGIRQGSGFELVGRAPLAEARGCSLMTADKT